jgi:hypothetical protein
MNENLKHIGEYKIDILTANMSRSGSEFKSTLKDAKLRKKALKASGYVVTIFKVTDAGGLIYA